MRFFKFLLIALPLFLTSCSDSQQAVEAPKKSLLIYCGVTMVKPVSKLAKEFEAKHNVEVQISQGGSQDLYDSLKYSQKGDLYLPGSSSYRINNEKDGLLVDHVLVGYNRLGLFVNKGNPKNLTNDIKQLTDNSIRVVLCDPSSGSLGRASRKMLDKQNLGDAAYNNAAFLTPDSRRTNEAFKNGQADLALNWYATGFWEDNKDIVDVIEMEPKFAKPKPLEFNLLKFSEEPALARQFMKFVSSDRGINVFKEYGFLTESEYQAIKNK